MAGSCSPARTPNRGLANVPIAPTSFSGRPRHRLAGSRSSPLALVAHSPDPRWGLDAMRTPIGALSRTEVKRGFPARKDTDL